MYNRRLYFSYSELHCNPLGIQQKKFDSEKDQGESDEQFNQN